MKIENDNLYFDSEKEKELYLDLKGYLLKEYKGKRALKRLVNNIAWFMDEGRGDFFAGFVFDTQGTLSCWGIYTGGKDKDKDNEYKNFMQNYCDALMKTKDRKDNLVSFAITVVYNKLVKEMVDRECNIKCVSFVTGNLRTLYYYQTNDLISAKPVIFL